MSDRVLHHIGSLELRIYELLQEIASRGDVDEWTDRMPARLVLCDSTWRLRYGVDTFTVRAELEALARCGYVDGHLLLNGTFCLTEVGVERALFLLGSR